MTLNWFWKEICTCWLLWQQRNKISQLDGQTLTFFLTKTSPLFEFKSLQ